MKLPFGTPGAIRAVPPTAGFLGQGVSYPPDIDAAGRLKLSFGQQAVEDSLRSMIETAKGERVMLADYGCAEFLFEPANDLDRGAAALARCVADHEPRVSAVDVSGALDETQQGSVNLSVTYQVAGGATPQVLTYDFFNGPSVSTAPR